MQSQTQAQPQFGKPGAARPVPTDLIDAYGIARDLGHGQFGAECQIAAISTDPGESIEGTAVERCDDGSLRATVVGEDLGGPFSLHGLCGAITSRMRAQAPAETAAAEAAPSPEAGRGAVDDPDADAAADADPLLDALRCIRRGRHGIGMVSLS